MGHSRVGLRILLVAALSACALGAANDRYRLGDSADWRVVDGDDVLGDVEPRYQGFFDLILDPGASRDPDIRALRRDLEQQPANVHSFDALNAIAIAYFELNARAQSVDGSSDYLADSFRAAKMLALPWRAYSEVAEPELRTAILDFFEDAASDKKPHAASTAPRLMRIVANLEAKEPDPERRARIVAIVAQLKESTAQGAGSPF